MHFVKSIFWNQDEWRLRTLWRIVVYLAIAAILINPVILLLDEFYDSILNQTSINFIVAVGFFSSLAIVARYVDKSSLERYGIILTMNSLLKFLSGIIFGAFLIMVIGLLLWGFGLISPEKTFFSLTPSKSFYLLFFGQIIRYIFGSIFEEVFSRAFLIKNISEGIRNNKLNDNRSIFVACFFTSFLFGILHIFNPEFSTVAALNLSLIGLLFALSYVFTGNLAMPIGIHFGWNVFQNIVFGFPNSGKLSEISFLTFRTKGSELWTGGSFGLEGSLLTTFVILLAITILFFLARRKNTSFTSKIILYQEPHIFK